MLKAFLKDGTNHFGCFSVALLEFRRKHKNITTQDLHGDFEVLTGLGFLKKEGFDRYSLTKQAFRLLKTKDVIKIAGAMK